MAYKASDYLDASLQEFRTMIFSVIESMGYSVNLVRHEDDHHVQVNAFDRDSSDIVVFWGRRSRRRSGVRDVKRFLSRIEDEGAGAGVFISPSGFTPKAMGQANDVRLRLFTTEELNEYLGEKPGSDGRAIFERVFESGLSLTDVRKRFEDGRKAMLFGVLGSSEEVKDVSGRYTPVGAFELIRSSILSTRSSKGHVSVNEGRCRFYVNLNTCLLYYVSKGVLNKGSSLKTSGLLRTLSPLPNESISLMGVIIEAGQISLKAIMESHGIRPLSDGMESLVALNGLGLIVSADNGEKIISNVSLPSFGDERFDLGSLLCLASGVDSDFEADGIVFTPDYVSILLSNLFRARVEFKGVVYMPYYCARYINNLKELRHDFIVEPKFAGGAKGG
ncbi:restriction endonuclease [Candidatus Altiarchaeota archaeon]